MLPRTGLLIGLFSLLPIAASAQILFSFQLTATNGALGYTSGNTYTFNFTLNDYTPATPAGLALTNNLYSWSEESTSDPILFSSFGGDSLAGTYTRPSDPANQIQVLDSSQGTANRLLFASFVESGSSNGLTVNGSGNAFNSIQIRATFTGLTFEVEQDTLPNPIDYFSAYMGETYLVDFSIDASVTDAALTAQANFNIVSLTITDASVIPEPSAYAAIFGLLTLGLAVCRRQRRS